MGVSLMTVRGVCAAECRTERATAFYIEVRTSIHPPARPGPVLAAPWGRHHRRRPAGAARLVGVPVIGARGPPPRSRIPLRHHFGRHPRRSGAHPSQDVGITAAQPPPDRGGGRTARVRHHCGGRHPRHLASFVPPVGRRPRRRVHGEPGGLVAPSSRVGGGRTGECPAPHVSCRFRCRCSRGPRRRARHTRASASASAWDPAG